MQFDETDLISNQSARQVPPQRPVQSVAEILQKNLKKRCVTQEDLRHLMKESERIAFWVSKTSFLEQQLNGNTEELERMRGRVNYGRAMESGATDHTGWNKKRIKQAPIDTDS
ncbi:hypothetical protein pdam_00021242 [Pocillopora damicornis]|uniref:Uncharacterized protein n=1 Tax=Pocillopora damicornis TaxID=46731 RepID=A0A3M6UNZ4_POCDA|nr:hypothetical protein pdam_00021242 [Pocillopora damicornis]